MSLILLIPMFASQEEAKFRFYVDLKIKIVFLELAKF